ncbi:MAG: CPBP family intramembrane metalloprotease [Coriobacteriales bacterium]|nr:CPBP family intramembrane metalloprotease [Coriobacteriales bacterium]
MKKPLHTIAFASLSFVAGMLLLLSVGGLLQQRLGMMGMILTQLMILTIALVSTRLSHLSFKQVFRVRRSTRSEWLGSLLVYLCASFAASTVSYLLMVLLPDMEKTGEYIGGFIVADGFALALIGVAVLPGICEEAWHRGYLLSSLDPLRSVAVRVIVMGLVFGLFHFDSARFLQTMILGCALSFMRVKTDNLLVPVVFHLLNNLVAVCVVFAAASLTGLLPGQEVTTLLEGVPEQPSLVSILPFALSTAFLSVLFGALGRYVFRRAQG